MYTAIYTIYIYVTIYIYTHTGAHYLEFHGALLRPVPVEVVSPGRCPVSLRRTRGARWPQTGSVLGCRIPSGV